jgi:8-oxo-dGTP diphosphatase
MKDNYEPVEGVRVTSRGICINEGKVLVVKRLNNGIKYMVLPGGGIDPGEDPLEAVAREFLEETSVVVKPVEILDKLEARPGHNAQYISQVEYLSGVPQLDPSSEEYSLSIAGKNVYKPCWVSIEDAKSELVPEEFRQYL